PGAVHIEQPVGASPAIYRSRVRPQHRYLISSACPQLGQLRRPDRILHDSTRDTVLCALAVSPLEPLVAEQVDPQKYGPAQFLHVARGGTAADDFLYLPEACGSRLGG